MFDRYFKEPDGYDCDGPYWILPSDRKTHDFQEWLRYDKEYWKEKNKGT